MRLFLISTLCLVTWSPLVPAQGFGGGSGESEQPRIMTKQLKHSDAEDVVSILNELFPVKFSSNKQTNTIYARASKEQIAEVNAIIEQMEQAIIEVEKERKKTRNAGGGGLSTLRSVKKSRGVSSIGGLGGTVGRMSGGSARRASSTRQFDFDRALVPQLAELAAAAAEFGREHPKVKAMSFNIETMRKSLEKITKELDSDIASIERDLIPLVVEHAKLKAEFGMEHPEVRALKKQIELIRETFLSSLDTNRAARSKSRRSAKYSAQHAALETEVSKVVDELRVGKAKKLPAEDVKKIREGLTEAVGNLFDVRQRAEDADWQQADEQLNKIRTRLDERKKNRDEIVQKRVDELLAEDGKD